MAYIKAIPVVLSKTATYTVSTNDGDNVQVNVNATSGAVTINLYAASGNAGKIIAVKKTDSSTNAVTLDGNASETLDGSLTLTLSGQNDAVYLVCDGTNWQKCAATGAGALSLGSLAANDVIYAASATQLARLAAGTAGQVLTTQGAGSAPTWSTVNSTGDSDQIVIPISLFS
jgi:hypothetical protein